MKVHAMSVHKSQGSEFKTLLVLPDHYSQMLMWELLNTTATRVKSKLGIMMYNL
jgi:ATP-dependent exoDNAse (exonuclease V) alpha subunit